MNGKRTPPFGERKLRGGEREGEREGGEGEREMDSMHIRWVLVKEVWYMYVHIHRAHTYL